MITKSLSNNFLINFSSFQARVRGILNENDKSSLRFFYQERLIGRIHFLFQLKYLKYLQKSCKYFSVIKGFSFRFCDGFIEIKKMHSSVLERL